MNKQLKVAVLTALAASGMGFAADAPSSPKHIEITSLIRPLPAKPDFDVEVLAPLRKAQAEKEAVRIEKERLAAVEAVRVAEVARLAALVVPVRYITPAVSGDAKAFIYGKESGNDPAAINPKSGACGLGQALPCSKLPCSLADYACQDNWFSTVYLQRYHFSWEEARAFWLANGWW